MPGLFSNQKMQKESCGRSPSEKVDINSKSEKQATNGQDNKKGIWMTDKYANTAISHSGGHKANAEGDDSVKTDADDKVQHMQQCKCW